MNEIVEMDGSNISDRLDLLLRILEIPIEERWDRWSDKKEYTVYHYWRKLGLLDQQQFDDVFLGKRMKIDPIRSNFFASIDLHFPRHLYRNGLVADVGSGFGFITFWLILSGAATVHSIGDPLRISFIERLYAAAVERNLLPANKLQVKPGLIGIGDTTLSENISPRSLDLVLLNDTLEHITPRILPFLIRSAHNDLKKGGSLIARQINTDSPAVLKILGGVWADCEKNKFIPQRLSIIRERFVSIKEKDALLLAQRTRGLDSIDLKAALDEYERSGNFPSHDLDVPPIDVELDEPCEGDTSIQRLRHEFKTQGFTKVEAYPDVSDRRRSRPFQSLARKIPDLFFKLHIFDQVSVFRCLNS